MKSGDVLLGVLAGFAAGAVIGILFAPDKGSVTRKKIAEIGDEYAEGLKEKFGNLVDEVSKKCEEVISRYKESVDKAETETQEVKIEG
jgi:gas vesicle protein